MPKASTIEYAKPLSESVTLNEYIIAAPDGAPLPNPEHYVVMDCFGFNEMRLALKNFADMLSGSGDSAKMQYAEAIRLQLRDK